jgi:hypothetical protein
MMFRGFQHGQRTMRELAEVGPVLQCRQVMAPLLMYFVIAHELGLLVDVIVLQRG